MELHEEIGAVRRETILDAPRDEVWARIASPEGLASWLADEVALDTAEGATHLISIYARRGYRLVEHVRWQHATYRSVIMSKRLGTGA